MYISNTSHFGGYLIGRSYEYDLDFNVQSNEGKIGVCK